MPYYGLPISGPLRLFYEIDVGGTNIGLTEAGTTSTVTVISASDTIEWVTSEDGTSTPEQGLLDKLETELNASGANTYQVSSATPSGHTISECGLEIVRTAGSDDFALDFTVTDAIDPRALGWSAGTTQTATSSGTLTSPLSLLGVWDPATIFSEDYARRQTYSESEDIGVSSEHTLYAQQIERGDTERMRMLAWQAVPDAHIWRDLADDTEYADAAGLPVGDTHNAWMHLWTRLSGRHPAWIVYNERIDHLINTHTAERVYLDSEQARSSPDGMLTERDEPRGSRDMEMDVIIDADTS